MKKKNQKLLFQNIYIPNCFIFVYLLSFVFHTFPVFCLLLFAIPFERSIATQHLGRGYENRKGSIGKWFSWSTVSIFFSFFEIFFPVSGHRIACIFHLLPLVWFLEKSSLHPLHLRSKSSTYSNGINDLVDWNVY